jgi:EF-P beta-lysylation protein EpmB
MITAAPVDQGSARWQQSMRNAWRDPTALLEHLGLDPAECGLADDPGFSFLVTPAFAGRMRRGDADDPLLRQVLPLADEQRPAAGFGSDPVGDRASRALAGVLHKYAGRALLLATAACPIHCRYCFRREFDYADNRLEGPRLAAAIDYIARTASIEEVILSGGDPLMLSDRRLGVVTDALAAIPHLRRLRIHTRVPVTLPERVDAGLLAWLHSLPWPVVVVIHANHPNEFDASVEQALRHLRPHVHAIFSQAVLLKGVNDDVTMLQALHETGFEYGIVPYYLHLLDRVTGSAQHEVGEQTARSLVEAMRRRVSGYLVPRLVRERAGDPYKLPVL